MPPNFKSHRVGDATITKVEEQELRNVPASFLYPAAEASNITGTDGALREYLEEGGDSFRLSVHTWVVRTPEHLILIDTGSGNDKERPRNPTFHRQSIPFIERLKAVGVHPEHVDFVFNTHLHVDHSGWNTRLEDGKWVPAFPNARYVFPRRECEYYSSADSHNEVNVPSLGVFEDSVAPIIEAGLADFIQPSGGRYLDIFEFIPTPGHSVGHMSIALRSHGETAIFGGDIMHSPVQVYRPDLNTVFCEFQSEASASRLRMLNLLADEDALYLATHFPASSAGVVGRVAEGFSWTYF
ncbi:MBL fold metallo-hydrolase [Rhizobium leguminosarum]|uniref:MBL fold metallo-hydrolase n=1 Tax=Rhizobium leguminosarum TaxID=384 RepID=UPI003ED1721F